MQIEIYHRVPLQPCQSNPNIYLDVEPSLIENRYKDAGTVNVQIANAIIRNIVIDPEAVLCEMQPVIPSTTSDLDKIDINKSDLTPKQLERGMQLIKSYESIFVKGDIDIDNIEVKNRIDLLDDKPFKQRFRRIPPAMSNNTINSCYQPTLSGNLTVLGHLQWCQSGR